jgi:5-(carboxyamino)imidazole ribonucleotide synthase
MIGAGHLSRMSAAPAISLGVDLILLAESDLDSGAQVVNSQVGNNQDLAQIREFAKKCDLITYEPELVPISIIKSLESEGFRFYPTSESFICSQDQLMKHNGLVEESNDFDFEISVLVARSPHGQAATWAPTKVIRTNGICTMTITPAPDLSEYLAQQAQEISLNIAAEIKLVGVTAVEMYVKGDQLFINGLKMRPHNSGNWTIDGSITSQFEQHLRAILDLPLGDTSMTARHAVSGNVLGGGKTDMYRPYLHLLARTPKIKVHQYRREVKLGSHVGHLTLLGENLPDLTFEVQHAIDYMSGAIDE